jgi:tetratricopeptide (TPR) repeat protein
MRVLTFEEHSSVLATWWSLPRRPRTLIYLDAHLDLQQLSPKRLRRILDCTTAQQVAELGKPHHLFPDQGFSYSLEDFLYPAHRLGMIERIIWVAPPRVHAGYTAATLERLQQMDGVEFDELLSFQRFPHGWIAGRLLDIELTICDYRQLAQMALPADSLIDIDIDFFIDVPADAPWERPRDVFRAIAALPLKPELVTISRSVSSGFTPLRYRFFADHLAALFEQRQADSDHFERLFDVDALCRATALEATASQCRSELELHPDCPATWHLLSLASSNPQEAQAAQQQAAALCPAYEASILREACEFPCRNLALDLSTVRALENRFVARQRSPADDALTWAALGLLHCHLGRVEAARACYRHTTSHFSHHADLAIALANALIQARRPDEALPFLEVAAESDKTAAGAHMLMGSILAGAKEVAKAQLHLQAASARAPAWMQVLELRSVLHAVAGELQAAAELRQCCQKMRQQARGFAERLGAPRQGSSA